MGVCVGTCVGVCMLVYTYVGVGAPIIGECSWLYSHIWPLMK